MIGYIFDPEEKELILFLLYLPIFFMVGIDNAKFHNPSGAVWRSTADRDKKKNCAGILSGCRHSFCICRRSVEKGRIICSHRPGSKCGKFTNGGSQSRFHIAR